MLTHYDHHHHDHAHIPLGFGKTFALCIALNVLFVVVEGAFGFAAHSMALLADAGHNLSDVLGLVVAWVAFILSNRQPSERFTYGLGNTSILSALFNAIILMFAVGMMTLEAIQKFAQPGPVSGGTIIAVASVGILVNGLTAWLLARGGRDLNIRGAYMHMMADLGVSVAVVLAGAIILYTGWLWIDPAISLLIAAFIVLGTWGLLSDSLRLSLAGVPRGISLEEVRSYLSGLSGVRQVHDLHIWPLSTSSTALTCHLVIPQGHPGDDFLLAAATVLKNRFDIHHATFQVEISEEAACIAPGRH